MTTTDRRPDNYVDYAAAAAILWGASGTYVHDCYAHWLPLFPGLPEQLPIVVGLAPSPYGRCLGLTRGAWEHGPRISISANLFRRGRRWIDDTMVHEMLHVWLHTTDRNSDHDSDDWYAAVQRLSPNVLGHELDVRRGADRKSVRVPNPKYEPGVDDRKTVVRKVRVEGAVCHDEVARWPCPFRPDDHDWGEPIDCPTY